MISRNITGPRSHVMALRLPASSKNTRGSKGTAMQSLQLHLTGTARSWLSKLGRDTIGSWDELTKQFTSNLNLTYKRPASTEEVKACMQSTMNHCGHTYNAGAL
jgi:hypothetical protein